VLCSPLKDLYDDDDGSDSDAVVEYQFLWTGNNFMHWITTVKSFVYCV